MSESKSLIRSNYDKDPSYRPYCMRCPGLVRMKLVRPLHWECECGAIHIEPCLIPGNQGNHYPQCAGEGCPNCDALDAIT